MAEMDDQEIDGKRITVTLFPPDSLNELERAALDQRKLILLVNLDKTLVNHRNGHDAHLQGVHYVQTCEDGKVVQFTARLRPGARWLLKTIKEKYNIYLTTGATLEYALCMKQLLEGDEKLIEDQIFCGNRRQIMKDDLIKDHFSDKTPLVVKIDHRQDFWKPAANLLLVPPYKVLEDIPAESATTSGLTAEPSLRPRVGAGEEKEEDEIFDSLRQTVLSQDRDYWENIPVDTFLTFVPESDQITDIWDLVDENNVISEEDDTSEEDQSGEWQEESAPEEADTSEGEEGMERPAAREESTDEGEALPEDEDVEGMERPAAREESTDEGETLPEDEDVEGMEQPVAREESTVEGEALPEDEDVEGMEQPAAQGGSTDEGEPLPEDHDGECSRPVEEGAAGRDSPDAVEVTTPETGRQDLMKQLQALHPTDERPVPGRKRGFSSIQGSASAAKVRKGESTVHQELPQSPENVDRWWFVYQGGTPQELKDNDKHLVWTAVHLQCIHQLFFSVYDHYDKSKFSRTRDIVSFLRRRVLNNKYICAFLDEDKEKWTEMAASLGAFVSGLYCDDFTTFILTDRSPSRYKDDVPVNTYWLQQVHYTLHIDPERVIPPPPRV